MSNIEEADPTAEKYDDPVLYPMKVTCDTTSKEFLDRFVDYNLRGKNDVVLSGPVISGWGPGKYYQNRMIAFKALAAKFGEHRVRFTEKNTSGRWSFVVKNLKTEGALPHEA